MWANQKKGASIECDNFRTWIRQEPMRKANDYQEELILKHTSALTLDYLNLGLDVAIDNVWRPDSILNMINIFSPVALTKAFYLQCQPEENHRRDQLRIGSHVMGKRLDELDEELRNFAWPDEVIHFDSTNMSVEETVTKIESFFP